MALNKLVKDKKGSPSNDYYVMMSSALKIEDISLDSNFPKAGALLLDDEHCILAMKKAGHGMKPFKKWISEEVTYKEEDSLHPSTAFWKSQYAKWRLYDSVCDPKTLASYDLVETLLMRLSFHLRNEDLLQNCRSGNVYFGPFSIVDGIYDLSYQSICWYLCELGDDEERGLEKEWCSYAMGFAEEKYLEEWAGLDHNKRNDVVDSKQFRGEIMLHVTKLRNHSNRNSMAHIFSTSVGQVWVKPDASTKPKNRCLLDVPKLDLDSSYKEKLLVLLEDLATNLPTEVQALKNIIPMQAFFLKKVFQKQFPRKAPPKPAQLPTTVPPSSNQKRND